MGWGKKNKKERIQLPGVQVPVKYESPYMLGQELTKMGGDVAELRDVLSEIATNMGSINQAISQITNSQNAIIPYVEDMQKRLRAVEEWITEFTSSDVMFKERGIKDAENVKQSIKRLGEVRG